MSNITRHTYRELTVEEKELISNIKSLGEEFLILVTTTVPGTPISREAAIARTKIEEAVMWAVKGVTK